MTLYHDGRLCYRLLDANNDYNNSYQNASIKASSADIYFITTVLNTTFSPLSILFLSYMYSVPYEFYAIAADALYRRYRNLQVPTFE